MKPILFAVNNELNYDQRMIRICGSLNAHNFNLLLVGKHYTDSGPLSAQPFKQHRIYCRFRKGKMAYVEFNSKLFFFLLMHSAAGLCAIDLDTIFPVLIVSRIKRCKRLYDAHELFTEMKEIISRPFIKKIWNWVERNTVPHFSLGYTVSESIALAFRKKYDVNYKVIRNMPVLVSTGLPVYAREKVLLYQGAVNHGRCLEYLIPAMKQVPSKLVICGDGNFMKQSQKLVKELHLSDKITFTGMLLPQDLKKLTETCYIGINLVEPDGLNQLYSLANKFFDYMHAAVPQLTMDFAEYARINNRFKVAVLIPRPEPALIASALNLLLENDVLYRELEENCIRAREIYNWQVEEKELVGFYNKLFN